MRARLGATEPASRLDLPQSVRLRPQRLPAEPVWSPDGTRIAFESFREGNGDIYVMNADGSGLTRLTSDPALDSSPSWSPDGTRIAFESSREGNINIYVIDADGSNLARLTDDPAVDKDPVWSPLP